jgi:hypothetical protein
MGNRIAKNREDTMMSLNKTARLAGIFYLINILTGVFSEFFVRSKLIVWGDAAVTGKNIAASETLFRFSFMSDLVMIMCFLLMGVTFYQLLKPVNKNSARIMLAVNVIGVPIMALNLINYFAPVLISSGGDYLNVFSAEQLNALSMLFLNLYKYGYIIATISFGAYLLPLGYLFFKSGYLPKFTGILLMVASGCFMVDLFTQFLVPGVSERISNYVLAPTVVAEFTFCLWLLFKGVREQKPAVTARLSVSTD